MTARKIIPVRLKKLLVKKYLEKSETTVSSKTVNCLSKRAGIQKNAESIRPKINDKTPVLYLFSTRINPMITGKNKSAKELCARIKRPINSPVK